MTFEIKRAIINIFILAICGVRVTQEQNLSSPCPDVFRYEKNGDNWYGVVEGTSSSYGNEVKMIIVLKYDGSPQDNDVGKIQRMSSDQEVRDAFSRGGTIRYRLPFNISPRPRVYRIVYNGREICRSQREESPYDITTATREHTVSLVGPPSSSWTRPTTERTIPTRRTTFETVTRRTRPVTRPTPVYRPPTTERQKPKCGVPNSKPNNLIVGGNKTIHGEWPWLVALFHYSAIMPSFKCGSTLIDERYVVTAAHCLYNDRKQLVDKENVILVAGASDVSLTVYDDENTRGLSEMVVHEEYDPATTVNDIALLILDEPVVYSPFVQPACLWDGGDDQEILVNSNTRGTVVGWGETGLGSSLQVPLRVDVPIVSLTTCRGSHEIFHTLTNQKSLCAGGRDNRGPCNGDSGSGLYIKQDDRWRLRGVVSNSLAGNSLGTQCNLTHFVVYADVAKHRDWLLENIANYN